MYTSLALPLAPLLLSVRCHKRKLGSWPQSQPLASALQAQLPPLPTPRKAPANHCPECGQTDVPRPAQVVRLAWQRRNHAGMRGRFPASSRFLRNKSLAGPGAHAAALLKSQRGSLLITPFGASEAKKGVKQNLFSKQEEGSRGLSRKIPTTPLASITLTRCWGLPDSQAQIRIAAWPPGGGFGM